ncbi:MAG: tetratricopeptide repeat protein [Aestuariivita sp.]|nr:tetratricopeptide repeat protein [Aestuariivita sp.]MCY4202068.1 tetratricopeptide repeat protein [Aestuariivita sp.]
MSDVASSPLTTALRAVFSGTIPHAVRLHNERTAGRKGYNADLLQHALSDTYGRLKAGDITDSWWRRVLAAIEQKYIAPEFFEVHAVKEWIKDDKVEEDVKTLAADQIMGVTSRNSEAIRRLESAYSEYTGEHTSRAQGPIEVVTGVLAAGYISSISSSDRPLAGMLQQMRGDFDERLDDFEKRYFDALDELVTERFPILKHVMTPHAERQLHEILSLRVLDKIGAKNRIKQLFHRVSDGDLSAIEETLKEEIYLWAARLFAEEKETLALAKELRERLATSKSCRDLSIIDALIRETDGNVDGALRSLRDAGDPDSRSVWFSILMRAKGKCRALQWFDESWVVDDLDFFSSTGWINWAIAAAKCGRWDDAVKVVEGLQTKWEEMPALAIVEGSLNSAFLLPEDFRSRVLDGPPLYLGISPITHPKAVAHHERSLECFRSAEQRLRGRIGKEWLECLTSWIRWLRLMDPDAKRRKAARDHLRAKMDNAKDAVALVPFAFSFEIDFDRKPLEAYLKEVRELGGLDDQSRVAEFCVNLEFMTHKEFRRYYEKNKEHLTHIIPSDLLVSKQVNAILQDESSPEDARNTIAASRDSLDKNLVKRLELLVDFYDGQDIRDRLEERYKETNSIVDLRNLIEFLKQRDDRGTLAPLCLELFRRLPTEETAIDVVASFSRPSSLDYTEILNFLNKNDHLLNDSEALLNAKSIALLHAGKFQKAREANERSKQKRLTAENLLLGTDIAIASGNWAALGGMVTQAWDLREELDATELVWLARVAGQANRTDGQALQMLRFAAERAHDNAAVLASAYWLCFLLGREEEADLQWLLRAAELSTDEEGPIWGLPLREVVEDWLPKRRKHLDEVNRKWAQGEIPIGVMADNFNVSLSRMLLDQSRKNANEADGRRRVALPIIAPGRPDTEIQDNWTVGLDVTSALVLQYLGILDEALDAFGHTKLPPDILRQLFQERAEARFHQPTRINGAKQILKLRDESLIKILGLERGHPSWLTNETGRTTAEVLQWARNSNGMVVCVRPIYSVGSLMQRRAELREYEVATISLISLCKWLKEHGKIASDVYKRIRAVLRGAGDTEDSCVPSDLGTKPLCFDDVALAYLIDAHALRPIAAALGAVYIHRIVLQEMQALVGEEDSEDWVVSGIEAIRHALTLRLAEGQASFLPQPALQTLNDVNRSLHFKATASLLESGIECDALCIDDRFLNNRSNFVGLDNEVRPILSVLDVIGHLVKREYLSPEDCFRVRHRLRAAGFALVPLEAEEICHWTRAAGVTNGQTVETVELRMLRQSTAQGGSLVLTKRDQAFALMSNSRSACMAAISEMWNGTDLTLETTMAHASWIWRNLMEAVIPDHQVPDFDTYRRLIGDVVSFRIEGLLIPLFSGIEARKDDYADWLTQTVLRDLWAANSDRIRAALSSLREAIEVTADLDISQAAYGRLFLELLPDKVRVMMIRDDPEFAETCGYRSERVLSVGQNIQVIDRDLFRAATAALVEVGEAKAPVVEGREITVAYYRENQLIRLSWLDNEGTTQEREMAELFLLSPSSEIRLAAFDKIAERLGATFESRDQLRDEIGSDVPKFDLVSHLLEVSFNGVATIQARMVDKIIGGKPMVPTDFVPESIEYFERLVAPASVDQTTASFMNEALSQFRRFLDRDLKGGLHICCLGAVHDDLSPGELLTEESDDDVWSALDMVKSALNPFSQLGALDVALYRQHDDRFREFASKSVERLLDHNFGFDEGTDVYRLLQIVGKFTLNRISLLEDGATKPGCWKRLGAWMQAGYVVETMLRSQHTIELDRFEDWTHQHMSAAGEYAGFVDARAEPMLLSANMSACGLRHEVLGRLEVLRRRHEQYGREVPETESIDGKLEELERSGLSAALWLPGPLDADSRPEQVPPAHINVQIEGLAEAGEDMMLMLVNLSQLYCLNETQLGVAAQVVESACDEASETDIKEVLQTLELASIVAAANRSTALCSSIGDGVVRISSCVTEVEVEVIPRILLQAALAFDEENEWFSWLDERLVEVAGNLPSHPNQSLSVFSRHLAEIGTILPTDLWFHERARSLVLAGLV